ANSYSAFLHGGALFTALLLSTLTSQSEIPKAVTGRLVIYKHKSLALYRPAALSIAQTLVDLPFATFQSVCFTIIFYFLTNLERTAPHYFRFFLFIWTGSLALTAMFRLIGNISPNIDVAHTISGIGLLVQILYSGYLQPYSSMHPWFIWFSFIFPLPYALRALLINEFNDLRIRCVGNNLIPGGPGFADISNQVCALPGSRPGQLYVLGRDYLADGYGIYVNSQWRYFLGLLGYLLVYTLLIALVMEFVEFGNTGYTINVYKRYPPHVPVATESDESESSSILSEEDAAAAAEKSPPISELSETGGPTDAQIAAGTTFTWHNVNYTVPVAGGRRQLLHDISGYVKPHQMTALMGSSGAGKTTLLDALSQRKTIGKLEGEMLMNGAPQPASFRRITGYAEQQDVHAPLVTVRELLRFSARLRQPRSVSTAETEKDVERVIRLLELTDIADCLVGDPESSDGISLFARKLLTIGSELVAKPKVCFLDEPTSSVDSSSAVKIVQILRRLASVEGQTILCTIHQPSSAIFNEFDRLLLLVRGGHVVYHGDIGDDAHTLINYFERNGAPKCPPTANPAEYILDVVGGTNIDWPQIWSESKERQDVITEIDRVNTLKSEAESDITDVSSREYAHDVPFQIQHLILRMYLMQWRNLQYNGTQVALQAFAALFILFTFYRVSNSVTDLQNQVFAVLQSLLVSILVINTTQPEYFRQRELYARESSTNQYGWLSFGVSVVLVEWIFMAVASTVYFAIFYWVAGLNADGNRAGFFYIMYVMLGLFAMTLGQAIAAFSPNDLIASMLNPVFVTPLAVGSGAFIPYSKIPLLLQKVIYNANPLRYFMEVLVVNQLHDVQIRCRPKEFYQFTSPAGMSCGDYAGDWIQSAPGYIDGLDGSNCRYCPYSVGDQYTSTLNWFFVHRWRNFCIVLGFVMFSVFLVLFMCRFYKVNKR
ncbi:ATP-binding cassette transporter snq2, partial [Coemansia sp. RSA 2705]